jgi:heptosyltransferase-2
VPSATKQKLLVVELWGIGDLAIATPFLRAASERFEVTLLAKPSALELQPRFWPQVRVETFVAPWTAFRHKYRFWRWPWKEMLDLRRRLHGKKFEFGLSTRRDPRDHCLLKFLGTKTRLGFPRLGSGIFLTNSLTSPEPTAHRYEFWRVAGKFLGIELPLRWQITFPPHHSPKLVLVHSGAGQPVRVWPLENYRTLVRRLRENGYPVQVVCDANQRDGWLQFDEPHVATPKTVTELIALMDQTGVFIGNDSGPGHLAAISGVPTFTIFGPQLPEYFVPLHPQAGWIEGMACPYKPCRDYCRFPTPNCLWNITEESAWPRVKSFVQRHLDAGVASRPSSN